MWKSGLVYLLFFGSSHMIFWTLVMKLLDPTKRVVVTWHIQLTNWIGLFTPFFHQFVIIIPEVKSLAGPSLSSWHTLTTLLILYNIIYYILYTIFTSCSTTLVYKSTSWVILRQSNQNGWPILIHDKPLFIDYFPTRTSILFGDFQLAMFD